MWLRKLFLTYKYPFKILKIFSYFLAVAYYLPEQFKNFIKKGNRKLTLSTLALLIFDSLSPKYLSKHSFKSVKKWFKDAGYKKIIKHPGISNKILGIK